MSQLEIASTVGTWVAAFLALLALGVFVGPFFIWRASQTERHQALDKLEAGEAESGGFISKGLRVSPNIRLFRRVRAPELGKEPQIIGQKLFLDENARLVSPSSAGWIQFSLLVKAHGVDIGLSGHLEIDDQRTWLPLHRNWLLILGIAGRFAMRSDEGKVQLRLRGRAKSVQRMPGLGDRRGTAIFKKKGNHFYFQTPRRPKSIADEAGDEISPLFGTFGTLWTMRNASNTSHQKVYYQHHTAEESGSPISDILGIQTLFWLAVGCLPLSNGDLYSLENCIIQHEVEETLGSRPFQQRTFSGATHRTHFEDDGDYDLLDMNFVARRASSYAISTEPNRQERHMSPRDPRVFRFSSVKERVEELARVASSLEQPDQAGNVYSLEEVDVPDDVARQLKESLGGTYHPISSNFVRLGKAGTYEDYAKGLPIFLERSSSQLLAKGLLDLPLSPEGYLVGFAKDSWCRTTLCNSAQLLPHLLTRICNDLDHLQVPESSKNDFIATADKLLVLCLNYQPIRTFYQTIYSLDIILQELLPLNAKAMASVGVVTITSAEFRDFLMSVV